MARSRPSRDVPSKLNSVRGRNRPGPPARFAQPCGGRSLKTQQCVRPGDSAVHRSAPTVETVSGTGRALSSPIE